MKWWNVNRAYRSTRRLARVLVVLIRYGFGEVLHRMNLARPALKVSRLVRRGTGPSPGLEGSVGERLRMALEELGPTFIKLGQLLATRPDLLPPDIIAQLQRLQRHVPPLPFSQIRPVIEQELGAPLESLFASFDEEPMGSASIAQVYRARLPWGRDAAVKVIKPGIEKQVMADLDILETLAVMLENRVEESRQFRPGKVVEQFRRSIRREMDLTFEAYSMVRFGQEFEGDESVLIPEVFWERCSSRILTMELMEGTPLTDLDSLKARGVDLAAFAQSGSRMMLRQIFEYGVFHGDPHPGNIYYLEGGRVGLVDYGMTGRISKGLRERLTDLLSALGRRDARDLALVLLDLNVGEREVDLISLRERLADFVQSYYGVPLKHLNIRRVIGEGFGILREHNIEIPPHLSLLLKVLTQVESVGRSLDPDFSVMDAVRPFAEEMVKRRLEPARLAKENIDLAREFWSVISRAPEDLGQIIRKIRTGRIKVDVGHLGLNDFLREQDRVSNRISFAIITGSVVVGSSILFSTGVGPTLFGMPAIGLLGYTLAAGLGLWLLVDILRSGRF